MQYWRKRSKTKILEGLAEVQATTASYRGPIAKAKGESKGDKVMVMVYNEKGK